MHPAASAWFPLRRVLSDARIVDAAIAAALTVLTQVQLPVSEAWWLRLLALVTTAALAFRRRLPLAVACVVAAAVAVMGLSAEPPSVFGEYLAVMLAAYTLADRCELPAAAGGGLLLLAGIVAHDWQSPQFGGLAGTASDAVIPAVVWAVGRAVHAQRGRAERARDLLRALERERLQLAQLAVAAERTHLARELHDVVTHSMSVVVIQAQGAQRLLGEARPDVVGALTSIESAGRAALTEMRALLGVLREEQAPSSGARPTLADVPHLLDQVRAAGLPVTLSTSGVPVDLEPGLDLSAYRVVQEALTNTLKYAADARAAVELGWREGALEVSVTDTGGSGGAGGDGTGRGLAGMRERVARHGGLLEAGAGPDGGFRVWCRLPVDGPTGRP